MKNNIACLIPSAGKGSRTGLDFPKTLYKINSLPILIRIIKSVSAIDKKPTIIIKKNFYNLFCKTLKQYSFSAELIFQKNELGMGNSILQYSKSKKSSKYKDVLLIWGDIPFIRKSTINKLINFHYKNKNNFSLITKFVKNPYTIVRRNKERKIISIRETKLNKKKEIKYGERDIGIFLFNQKLVLNFLKKKLSGKYSNKEHSFLYIVEHLVNSGYKVDALSIANNREIISFNSLNDLK